jgi:S-DNA-T family DNA segregation ATPase FtsK/SpoIIIE
MDVKKKRKIVGILWISLGFFILLSLIYFTAEDLNITRRNEIKNQMGYVGFTISKLLFKETIGVASFTIPLLIMLWGLHLLSEKKIKLIKKITLYTILFSLYLSMMLAFIGMIKLSSKINEAKGVPFPVDHHQWGLIGGAFSQQFYNFFGTVGTCILFPTLVIITLLYALDIKFDKIKSTLLPRLMKFLAKISLRYDPRKFKPKKPTPGIRDILKSKKKTEPELKEFIPPIPDILSEPEPTPGVEPPVSHPKDVLVEEQEPILKPVVEEAPKPRPQRKYYFPSPQILDESVGMDDEVTWDELMNSAKTLEDKLADFGIQGKVVEINPGPVITRFEIEPGLGIKINRFTSLADDLALVMRARRIRVVAPIPGKAAIGVEIPNRKPSTVFIKPVIDSPQFRSADSPLTIALGKTIAGDIYVDDLARMPHLLIAGATGSGKSVCLNTIIASILFKAHPSQVQLVMIDPKRLELSVYAALKHHHLAFREDLQEEVVTNPSNAVAILRSLEMEMERRYELLAKAGVRDIEGYNSWIKTLSPEQRQDSLHQRPLEYLVLIIDELADLMLIAAREVEEPIARLTQMSRAVGIHLIVATQRPSVDVITGVIKANFPARMAFQVASKTDSRTILDMNGAEKLLGQGDMLFVPPGSPEPVRIHAAYISHEEVKRIVEHIHQQPVQDPKFKLPTGEEESSANFGKRFREEKDELFNEALKLVVRHQQGSVSLLQRRLKVGYARAARLIDQLEDEGYVGPFDGSKAREVLIDEEQLMEMGLY